MSTAATTKRQDAYRILSLLARGLDPFDESELHDTTCLNRAEVIRALLFAADEIGIAELNNCSENDRAGEAWTAEEDNRLTENFHKHIALQEIAQAHKRSSGGIIARVVRLKLVNGPQEARAYFRG